LKQQTSGDIDMNRFIAPILAALAFATAGAAMAAPAQTNGDFSTAFFAERSANGN
jgi:hypothetical protein